MFVSSCVQCLTTRVGLQGSLHPADTTGSIKKTSSYCSMSSSLSTNTSASNVSLFPSRTETNIETKFQFITSSLLLVYYVQSLFVSVIITSRLALCLLTFLGVGVGLHLQDHRCNDISVHVVERVGDPLRTKTCLLSVSTVVEQIVMRHSDIHVSLRMSFINF